ncbi:sigma-70 family RNA polymerase sigma factor [Pontibacillus yanchengensis]|uniref:Sigma-70 family RNA polymerase sigma factor n=2 Tax=Pontibacillus yanchengensis TaxID=462910 RepID=A0A6I5A5K9_9BACI|nr:sigma-70 family RNA polymerase sigma factor [Pontibacillus yanchengensis]
MQGLNHELNIVYKYLRKQRISHEDAQDLVQETAYKYLLYQDSIQPQKVRSWLIRVSLNLFYDQFRKNKRVHIGLAEENFMELSKDLPDQIVLDYENKKEITLILDTLRPVYKEALLLKYKWDFSIEDIAALLDMKKGTVKTYLFRAREQFAKAYRRFYYERS